MNLDYWINKIIEIIFYPNFSGILFWIRFIFLAISAFFFGFILWSVFKLSWLTDMFLRPFKEFLSFKSLEKERFQKRWLTIKDRLKFGLDAEAKLSILEGLELLEEVLKWRGYKGSLEEIAKEGSDLTIKSEDVNFLYRIKDNIISDPDLKISVKEREEVVNIFKNILSELDILK